MTVPLFPEPSLNTASPETVPSLAELSLNTASPETVTEMPKPELVDRFTTVGSLPLLVLQMPDNTTLSPLVGSEDAATENWLSSHQLPSVFQSVSTAAL